MIRYTGEIIESGKLDGEGRIIYKRYHGSKDTLYIVFEYDILGNMIKEIMYMKDGEIVVWEENEYKGGKITSKHSSGEIFFTYHSDGHLVKKSIQSKYGENIVEYTYSEFDINGNWLKRIAEDSKGNKTKFIRRITYFEGE